MNIKASTGKLLNRLVLSALSAAGLYSISGCTIDKQPVDYISPVIGTSTSVEDAGVLHGLGKTFPGAATPFGLVQLSPDTITGGDNGPGYSCHFKTIEGFSFIHMSGIGWNGDFGNFLVMPTTGPLKTACGKEENPDAGYRSRFSNSTEVATAGYYSVNLDDYNIKAEMTASPHAGILRFTYPESDTSRIQIDLARRIGGSSDLQYVKLVDDHTIEGWMKCSPDGGGWGNGLGKVGYTVYFYCQFSQPVKDFGVWSADIPDSWSRKNEDIVADHYRDAVANAKVIPSCKEKQGKHLGFYLEFPTTANQQVLLKSGISFVSIAGAKKNLNAEITDWNFDAVAANTADMWNDAVSRITVKGGTDTDKTVFYTSMYHTMIDPRSVSDVDGKYLAADNKVHSSDKFQYRTIFSGWDVFRSQFPLQTIINPQLVNDEVNSLIQLAQLSGNKYYPRWEIMNSFSGCMIGNPAVPVVLDAYAKGIRDYNYQKAYEYCRNSVDKFSNFPLGYIPDDISRTLEYAYTDWCTGRFADLLGNYTDAVKYYQRSKAYKNIYDPAVQWFHARKADGTWTNWQGKTVHGQGCIESNPFQQGWFVPQDIEGLIETLGEDFFLQELTAFFEKAPDKFTWNDYYNHPNEPVHQVAFMFPYIGKPWLTQKWSRTVCKNAYDIGVQGLCGNEDVGQMSAWYILAASGIHPVCPGDNTYIITSPVFDEITFNLDQNYASGSTFIVKAINNSPDNIYIQSIKLNRKPLDRVWITHEEITAGGTLELQMGPEPNKSLGSDPTQLLKRTKPLFEQ